MSGIEFKLRCLVERPLVAQSRAPPSGSLTPAVWGGPDVGPISKTVGFSISHYGRHHPPRGAGRGIAKGYLEFQVACRPADSRF